MADVLTREEYGALASAMNVPANSFVDGPIDLQALVDR